METESNYRKKLIVSADDFGLSGRANENILKLARLGKIDRVSILINGFVLMEDIKELQKSNVKIDLHLTFPEGIRKRRGIIRRSFVFLSKYALHKSSVSVLEKEWRKQIDLFFENYGRAPDGLNSHEYIHFFPAYFKIAAGLCEKYNIPYLRFGKKGVIKNSSAVSRILGILCEKNKRAFSASGLLTSDYLISLDWIKDAQKLKNSFPKGTIEIVCHPQREKEFKIIRQNF
ncbi:MAG: ChbG/HpnK family deacetylase [Candidatus Moranbacteria bacterium]|nr:ChbG/HpnK family deacetylase [Candidatus Moranbacteria bacterium]